MSGCCHHLPGPSRPETYTCLSAPSNYMGAGRGVSQHSLKGGVQAVESSQVAATLTHLRTIMPDKDGISSARLVRRDWLFVPTPSTLPPAIQVLVMPTFCVAPKALGTGRSYGQQKVSPREMPALASFLHTLGPHRVALSSSVLQTGPRMPYTNKNETRIWKSLP